MHFVQEEDLVLNQYEVNTEHGTTCVVRSQVMTLCLRHNIAGTQADGAQPLLLHRGKRLAA